MTCMACQHEEDLQDGKQQAHQEGLQDESSWRRVMLSADDLFSGYG